MVAVSGGWRGGPQGPWAAWAADLWHAHPPCALWQQPDLHPRRPWSPLAICYRRGRSPCATEQFPGRRGDIPTCRALRAGGNDLGGPGTLPRNSCRGTTCWTSVPMRTTVGIVTHFVQISKECICRESSSIRARLRTRSVQRAGLQPCTATGFRYVGPCEHPGPGRRAARGAILGQGGLGKDPGTGWQGRDTYRSRGRLPGDRSLGTLPLQGRPRRAGRASRIRQMGRADADRHPRPPHCTWDVGRSDRSASARRTRLWGSTPVPRTGDTLLYLF